MEGGFRCLKKMDADKQAFAQDVLTSLQQAQRGEGRVHQVTLSADAEARAKVGLTQSAFAQLMGVMVRTLQTESKVAASPRGRRKP